MDVSGETQELLDEMRSRIVRKFDPEKIILFGSQALGSAGDDSDIDLLVVLQPDRSIRELTVQIRKELGDVSHPKDIVVTTPERYEARQDISGTVERTAKKHGLLLYDSAA